MTGIFLRTRRATALHAATNPSETPLHSIQQKHYLSSMARHHDTNRPNGRSCIDCVTDATVFTQQRSTLCNEPYRRCTRTQNPRGSHNCTKKYATTMTTTITKAPDSTRAAGLAFSGVRPEWRCFGTPDSNRTALALLRAATSR